MNKAGEFVVYQNPLGMWMWSYRSGSFEAHPWELDFWSMQEAIDHFNNQGSGARTTAQMGKESE